MGILQQSTLQAYLRMCTLPVQVACRANAEYMSPSGKVPFIHVGNQVVSELGPIVQFTKAKGHSLSDGLNEVQKAEMKAYMELVNSMLLTAEVQPTELDALVFGHLFTILTTELTSDALADRVKNYSNLLSFCQRIEKNYFGDNDSSSIVGRTSPFS
ncbi:MTX2 protein, partial [Polypterus senegalus]